MTRIQSLQLVPTRDETPGNRPLASDRLVVGRAEFRVSDYFAGPGQSLLVLLLAICCGCGQAGPKRVAVRGAVEVKSKPLEQGTISFQPADGHQGPVANGVIADGEYQLSAAEGPTVGPHLAVISLLPGKIGSPEMAAQSGEKPARTKWEVKVEIEPEQSDHDFFLPDE